MQRVRLFLPVLLLVAFASGYAQDATVPDWTLETPDGGSVHLREKAGEKVTILFFWATWCPYCKALMPHLQSIWFEYGDAIEILAIDVFETGDPEAFLRNHGYKFTLLLNGDEVAERYNIFGTPGVIVVDQSMVSRFDLRHIQQLRIEADQSDDHQNRASTLAPYWAAEIRKAISRVLREGGKMK